jgi:hypothetical protein
MAAQERAAFSTAKDPTRRPDLRVDAAEITGR